MIFSFVNYINVTFVLHFDYIIISFYLNFTTLFIKIVEVFYLFYVIANIIITLLY